MDRARTHANARKNAQRHIYVTRTISPERGERLEGFARIHHRIAHARGPERDVRARRDRRIVRGGGVR